MTCRLSLDYSKSPLNRSVIGYKLKIAILCEDKHFTLFLSARAAIYWIAAVHWTIEQAIHWASPQALQGLYNASALEAIYKIEMALLTSN